MFVDIVIPGFCAFGFLKCVNFIFLVKGAGGLFLVFDVLEIRVCPDILSVEVEDGEEVVSDVWAGRT